MNVWLSTFMVLKYYCKFISFKFKENQFHGNFVNNLISHKAVLEFKSELRLFDFIV